MGKTKEENRSTCFSKRFNSGGAILSYASAFSTTTTTLRVKNENRQRAALGHLFVALVSSLETTSFSKNTLGIILLHQIDDKGGETSCEEGSFAYKVREYMASEPRTQSPEQCSAHEAMYFFAIKNVVFRLFLAKTLYGIHLKFGSSGQS